jgi:hypothetical protein
MAGFRLWGNGVDHHGIGRHDDQVAENASHSSGRCLMT